MSRKTLSPASIFEMVLRAHETGGVTFVDVRTQLKQLLASGASPAELLETLRRQQQWEPLPEPAHVEVLGMLDEALRTAPKNDDPAVTAPGSPLATDDANEAAADESSDFEEPGLPPDFPGRLGAQTRGPKIERPARTQNLRSLEARIAGQQADYTTLTRSYERAREAEAAATARATALTAELAAVQAARESERVKAQQVGEAATREARDIQSELRQLRSLQQARDTEFDHLTRRLVERDAQLESLEQERQSMRPQWAAHAAQLTEARAALAAERCRSEARDVELAAMQQERARTAPLLDARSKAATQLESDLQAAQALLAAEKAKTLRSEQAASQHQADSRRLSDALAARAAELAALQQELTRTAPLFEAQTKAVTQLESDVQAAQAEAQRLREAAAASSAAANQALTQSQADLQEARAAHAKLEAQGAQAAATRELELKVLRESLAAREVALADSLRSLNERETQLQAALQTAMTNGQDVASTAEQMQREANRLRESLTAGDATIAELGTEQQRAQEIIRNLTERAAASDTALARSEAALREAGTRIDALSRELADRETVVALPLPPTPASTPKPAPDLVILPQPTLASRPLPPRATPVKRPLPLRLIGAAAGILLCLLAAYFLRHRAPAALPAVVVATPAPTLPKAGTVIRDCLTCPEITVLPTGKFSQGSSGAGVGAAAFEKPLHVVAIKHVIGMATNLVTVDEFQQFITASGWGSQGCTTYDGEWKNRPKNSWSNPGFVQTGKHPVTCASWNDAQAYAKWLSAKAGHPYRLPSASEWEYAARAGGQAVTPWSTESAACDNANVADTSAAHRYPGWAAFKCDDGYVYTSPVGSFKANGFGLNDMLGNVFQWTQDCWRPDYVGAPIDGSARSDGQCDEHELRGGSWFTTPAYVRANYRNHFTADYRSSTVGIRLVRDFGS